MSYESGRKPPKGILKCSFNEAHNAGCIQAELKELFPIWSPLLIVTAGNPCAECPVWDEKGSECGCYQTYHTAYREAQESRQERIARAHTPVNVPADHSLAGLSIKEIAERLNISKSEVRRRKVAGTL